MDAVSVHEAALTHLSLSAVTPASSAGVGARLMLHGAGVDVLSRVSWTEKLLGEDDDDSVNNWTTFSFFPLSKNLLRILHKYEGKSKAYLSATFGWESEN